MDTHTIEQIIKSGHTRNQTGLEYVLTGLSHLYGGIIALRNTAYTKGWLKTRRLPCFVISIGNITVGGTGKTPMTIYVAQRLQHKGYRSVVISRGYKGSAEQSGGIVSDGRNLHMGPLSAGEEPYLMARQLKGIPVLVGRNRFESGMIAVNHFRPDIILLDDAFQHRRLERDLEIVLLDKAAPFGNTHLLPRGVLREHLTSLARGDLFIFTRADQPTDPQPPWNVEPICRMARPDVLFEACHKPVLRYLDEQWAQRHELPADPQTVDLPYCFSGRRILAFSGLAHNTAFQKTLRDFNGQLIKTLEFPDHHRYTEADLSQINTLAHQTQSELIVTTEKDYVKIDSYRQKLSNLAVLGVEIDFKTEAVRFDRLLTQRLAPVAPPLGG